MCVCVCVCVLGACVRERARMGLCMLVVVCFCLSVRPSFRLSLFLPPLESYYKRVPVRACACVSVNVHTCMSACTFVYTDTFCSLRLCNYNKFISVYGRCYQRLWPQRLQRRRGLGCSGTDGVGTADLLHHRARSTRFYWIYPGTAVHITTN